MSLPIFTVTQVANMQQKSVIPGIIQGHVHKVWDAKEREKDVGGIPTPVLEQGIILKEGTTEITVTLEYPDKQGGIVPSTVEGKKINVYPGQDGRGKIAGIVRGGDVTKEKNGRTFTVRYVNAYQREGSHWKLVAGQAQAASPQRPPPQQTQAGWNPPAQTAPAYHPPQPAPAPAPQYQQSDNDGGFDQAAPTQPTSAAYDPRLAFIAGQFQQCVEAALDVAKNTNGSVGQVVGSGWESKDIQAMAATIFIEANKRGTFNA